MSVQCPQCLASSPDDALYCADCGQLLVPYEPETPAEERLPVSTECPQCLASNPDEAIFCKDCGQLLQEPVHTWATRPSRLVAQIVDGIILVAPFVILAYILPTLAMFYLIAILVLQMVFLIRDGQTLGKKMVNIRIVVCRTGQNGGFVPNVLLRVIVNGLLGFIPLYGIVDVLFIFRSDRRCLHDLIAGTTVVKA